MTERDLVVSLQAAIAHADATWVNQPSHLRRRLEEELGADARQHRAQVHQLIVAAEERIPIRLKRNGWSPTERDELCRLLIATRGWTAEAADWTVTTWAAALGLTDERPETPSPSVAARREPSPLPKPKPPVKPRESAALPGPTDMPSEYFAEATELPSDDPVLATQLPDAAWRAPSPPAPVGPPASHEHARPITAGKLPRGGTRGTTRKAAAFLGHDVDIAYPLKAGHSPALLLLAIPIVIAGFVAPTLGGLLLPLFACIIGFGTIFWPARILAIRGDEVWLLSKGRGFSMKPTGVIAHGSRSDIVFAKGLPFPSVRFAGQRLWFQFPVTGAARRLPTGSKSATVEEARQ